MRAGPIVLVLLASACASAPADEPGGAPVVSNGHFFYDVGLIPLTTAALEGSAEVQAAMADPNTRRALQYAAECALPGGASVAFDVGGETVTLRGFIGLAPEWLDGPCEVECQEWVTACVAARSNMWGVPVFIMMTGPHPVLAGLTPEQQEAYPIQEGAFFGNMFEHPDATYACRGEGWDPYYLNLRACTRADDPCIFHSVGPCTFYDRDTDAVTDRHVCESETEYGEQLRCHDVPSDPGGATFPAGSRTFERVMTIFLADADWS